MIERDQGTLICRVCGQAWTTDEATASLLEELVAHAHTHSPDEAKPAIWLR